MGGILDKVGTTATLVNALGQHTILDGPLRLRHDLREKRVIYKNQRLKLKIGISTRALNY